MIPRVSLVKGPGDFVDSEDVLLFTGLIKDEIALLGQLCLRTTRGCLVTFKAQSLFQDRVRYA